MTILAVILTVLAAISALVWASRHYMITVERKTGVTLSGDYPGPPADAPMVSVVLAAKDEQDNIESCVRTMLDQDYPNFEMIVGNDRSGDRTGEILAAIARQDSRLKVINIESLPEGWYGKCNAMRTAIAASRGQWICMIDADARQVSRRTLSVAVQHALDTRADFLSILPVLEMKGFWENVIMPVCGGIMMIWFHPDKVNSPAKPNAYANGAFMMIKRDAYEAAGTHEAVRQCLNEDMHLARLVKEKGLSLRVVRAHGLYVCRMYTSFMQMVRGWSRIYFGTFGTLKRLMFSLTAVVLVSLMPYVEAALGLSLWAAGANPVAWWKLCGLAGSTAVVLQLTAITRFYRLLRGRPGLAWTFPLGCTIAAVALCMSLTRLRKGAVVTWRGTKCKTT